MRALNYLLLLAIFFILSNCESFSKLETREFFQIELTEIDSLDVDQLMLHANISDWVSEQLDDHGFIWTTSDQELNLFINEGKDTKGVRQVSQGGSFTGTAEKLTPNTTYTFAAYMIHDGETILSDPISYQTGLFPISTLSYDYQGGFELKIRGQLSGTDRGLIAIRHGFVWSVDNPEPKISDQIVDLGSRSDNAIFEGVVTGLLDEQKHYLRAFAEFSIQQELVVHYGNVLSFDGDLNYWEEIAPYGGGTRAKAIAFTIGNKAYVGTGDDKVFQHSMYEYSPDVLDQEGKMIGEWTAMYTFDSLQREGGVGFSLALENQEGWRGYLMGGAGVLESFKAKVWELDPTITIPASGKKGLWRKMEGVLEDGTVVVDRDAAVGFALKGKGYFGLGANGGMSFFRFNPNTRNDEQERIGSWEPVATPEVNARGATAVATSTHGYLLVDKNLYEFDPDASTGDLDGEWKFRTTFPGVARPNAVGFVIGNKLYFGTGGDQLLLNDFWEFDLDKDVWRPLADFPIPLRGATAFSLNNFGYLVAGFEEPNTNRSWRFAP